MSGRALAPGEAPPRRRAARRWEGPRLLDWFVPSRSELVLLALLAAFLAPFAGFMGPLTQAATLARWPLLGCTLVWFFLASRRAGSLRVVPLPLAITALFLLSAGVSSLLSPTPRVSGMKFAALAAVLLVTHAFAARVLAPMQWVRLLATLGVALAMLTLPTLLYGESIVEEYYRTEGAFGTGPNAVGCCWSRPSGCGSWCGATRRASGPSRSAAWGSWWCCWRRGRGAAPAPRPAAS